MKKSLHQNFNNTKIVWWRAHFYPFFFNCGALVWLHLYHYMLRIKESVELCEWWLFFKILQLYKDTVRARWMSSLSGLRWSCRSNTAPSRLAFSPLWTLCWEDHLLCHVQQTAASLKAHFGTGLDLSAGFKRNVFKKSSSRTSHALTDSTHMRSYTRQLWSWSDSKWEAVENQSHLIKNQTLRQCLFPIHFRSICGRLSLHSEKGQLPKIWVSRTIHTLKWWSG